MRCQYNIRGEDVIFSFMLVKGTVLRGERGVFLLWGGGGKGDTLGEHSRFIGGAGRKRQKGDERGIVRGGVQKTGGAQSANRKKG